MILDNTVAKKLGLSADVSQLEFYVSAIITLTKLLCYCL